ncbi:MAG: Methylase involved in ubiquinone/menaquinone biosynthesis [Algoriphagus marincola HL-49]|uniref:Methylase involved in ubiquinone/menaquinone biosynthesis n=1 Tax=Algoriphagus marincola HL-49 TaxID=1305737 RepID=A0A0P7Y892_9BACT|nr:MAG: Methylase involved in ubiquinone/menaquinone biosynthesis [Algoriphagus marincola HL-49]
MGNYIHGYLTGEQDRLLEQAGMLASLIYPWIDLAGRSKVLEVGSGVGAQTKVLLELYPEMHLTCVELEASQIEKARVNLRNYASSQVQIIQQDAQNLDLEEKYDGAFICWVLEHVSEPQLVIDSVFDHLFPGGIVYITEVFNSSFHYFPHGEALATYYKAFNELQKENGGNPDIGLQLGNLLKKSGFQNIELKPGGLHLDQSQPTRLKQMVEYWKKLMKSAAEELILEGKVDQATLEAMEADLDQLTQHPKAVFFYQFIQARAIKP